VLGVALLTTAKVATRFGVAPSTVSRWVKTGKLRPAVKLDGQRGSYLFDPAAVDRWAVQRGRTE
jgi:excisionase family DNA binding protein